MPDTKQFGNGLGLNAASRKQSPQAEPTLHTEIQWLLLKLGNDMGPDVRVARNNKSREWKGNRSSGSPNLRLELSVQFNDATSGFAKRVLGGN
jgi:hypothetical protein